MLSIDDLASSACKEEVIPFICLYTFPLCSCRDQELILPTKEECERISATTCRVELLLAIRLGYADLIPDCNLLPNSNGNYWKSY